MGIYFQDVVIKLLFRNQEIVEEDTKKIPVTKFNIGIKIRDWTDGRQGGSSKHKYTPSIKVINYGNGKSSTHSDDGDPVIFIVSSNDIIIDYNKNQFDTKEIKYIINFIKHNRINLHKYWYSPDFLKGQKLKEYQDKVQERLIKNVNMYDYKKDIGVIDDEIDY